MENLLPLAFPLQTSLLTLLILQILNLKFFSYYASYKSIYTYYFSITLTHKLKSPYLTKYSIFGVSEFSNTSISNLSLSDNSPTNIAYLLFSGFIPFDFGVAYITNKISNIVYRLLVPFDFRVVYINPLLLL